jgi:hypothetical protein
LFVSIVFIAQEPTKQQDIQKLLTSLHVKASVEKMAAQIIELFEKTKTCRTSESLERHIKCC